MVGKCITVKVKSTVGFYSLVKSIFQEKNLRLFLGIYYKLHGFKHAVRKIGSYEILIHLKFYWDFPGGPVVRTWHFPCRGLGLTSDRGTKIPQAAR